MLSITEHLHPSPLLRQPPIPLQPQPTQQIQLPIATPPCRQKHHYFAKQALQNSGFLAPPLSARTSRLAATTWWAPSAVRGAPSLSRGTFWTTHLAGQDPPRWLKIAKSRGGPGCRGAGGKAKIENLKIQKWAVGTEKMGSNLEMELKKISFDLRNENKKIRKVRIIAQGVESTLYCHCFQHSAGKKLKQRH